MHLRYGPPSEAFSYAELLESMPDGEFRTATRSTVSLLSFWGADSRTAALGACLGLGALQSGRAWFEYPVRSGCSSCGGLGKASFTDVMIDTEDGVVAAIEAKHLEPLYPTVETWLGASPTPNKQRVLQHWLRCCIGSDLDPSESSGLVYQMVHRTASACAVAAPRGARPYVVHLLFNSPHVNEYDAAVRDLSRRLASAQHSIRFVVVSVPAPHGADFDVVQRDVRQAPDGPDVLREALIENKRLFEFGDPVIVFDSG